MNKQNQALYEMLPLLACNLDNVFQISLTVSWLWKALY